MARGKKKFADFQEGLLPPWGKLGAVTRAKDRDSCPWIGSKKVSPCRLTHHGGGRTRLRGGKTPLPESGQNQEPNAQARNGCPHMAVAGCLGSRRQLGAHPGPTMLLISVGPPALGIYLALGWSSQLESSLCRLEAGGPWARIFPPQGSVPASVRRYSHRGLSQWEPLPLRRGHPWPDRSWEGHRVQKDKRCWTLSWPPASCFLRLSCFTC